MNSIFNRRSIRRYTNDPISAHNIQQIIEAAMHAPSAYNQQPWEFVVINDSKLLNNISEQSTHAYMAKSAPAAILICVNNDFVKHKDYALQDCSAATQNMLIEIQELGLGGVWVGISSEKKLGDFLINQLNLPNSITPFSLVVFGQPAEHKPPHDYCSKERIHYNKW